MAGFVARTAAGNVTFNAQVAINKIVTRSSTLAEKQGELSFVSGAMGSDFRMTEAQCWAVVPDKRYA